MTITGSDATTGAKGIAQFSADNFSVTAGAVSIKDGGVANAELVNSTITIDCDSGDNNNLDLGDTFVITGGTGITTTVTGDTVSIDGDDATTTTKGIASFSTDNFSVISGAVSIKDSGIANDELAGGINDSKLEFSCFICNNI